MSRRALILGSRSVMAQAIGRRLAAQGWDLILAARRSAELDPFAADTRLRWGREVKLLEFDALDFDSLAQLPARAHREGGAFDLVVLVFGYLGDQDQTRTASAELLRVLHTNFTGAALALSHLAGYLEESGGPGGIIGISSVAGDRGRRSNYPYGAAKGALSLFLQGLRNRLSGSPVHVMTVKPGFVDTPMTEGLEGLFLVASPDRVAADILKGYEKRRDVLYTPWFWRYIMLIIRNIPERVFKHLRL